MRVSPTDWVRRGAALVCCLGAIVSFAGGDARAGVVGSYHDFSVDPIGSVPQWRGQCSVCHLPHGSKDTLMLWTRQLSQERSRLLQVDNPNYLPGTTLACYDCHDDSNPATAPGWLDDDPVNTSWTIGQFPQNIAFTDNPSLQGGTLAGYYELYDGRLAPQDTAGPTDGSPTGGHYWKRPNAQLSGTPTVRQGDKLDCSLCHDPHNSRTGTNEAFFLTETTNGGGGTVALGDGLNASDKNDATNPNRSRNGTGTGREMCADACHAYSDQDTPKTLWGNPVPRPPATISQHLRTPVGTGVPCVKCHLHNRISASCRECHGFPPLIATPWNRTTNPDGQSAGYSGTSGAGAHQRHKDALGDAIFECGICHGPNAGAATWHNEAGNGVVTPDKVNIMGDVDYWGAGSNYTGTGGGAIEPGYVFNKKGGGDQRCSGLVCHGSPPDSGGALNWTDNMVDGDGWRPSDGNSEGGTGSFVGADGANICRWCHDDSPARVGPTGITAPNVLGTGGAPSTATNWGAEVNGHGLAAASQYDRDAAGGGGGRNGADKNCAVCHDARYRVNATPPPANTPWKTHFDGANDSAQKRLKGTDATTINNQSPATVEAVCLACHQFAGPDAGTQVSHHGNDSGGGYIPLEGAFTRVCHQCHDVHGANWNGTSRNLYMVGSWVDADNDGVVDAGEAARVDSNAVNTVKNITAADNAVVFTSRTGADSFDENDGAYSAANDTDDVCATCHAPATGGGGGTGGGLHNGTTSSFDMRGQDCTQCHDHDFDDDSTTTDGDAATADGFMPSGCEGCHGKECIVHRGRDGVANNRDDAPNVMTTNCGSPPGLSVWDGTWWDTTQGGGSRQQGGHGDPDGREGGNAALTPTCLACHNSAVPAGTHLDGTYNSLGTELAMPSNPFTPRNINRWTELGPLAPWNANNAHLLPTYFTKYPANGVGEYRWQVAVDNYCANECHPGNGVQDMRHERDTQPADANHWSVEMGTHLTRTTPTSYITDANLTTDANNLPNYAPCVACHNPHGSMNTDAKASGTNATNRMIIDDFNRGSTLCNNCHQ